VQRAPGIPHALFGRTDYAKLGRNAPREYEIVSYRHRPARPDDPVFQGAGDGIEKLRRTGSSAFAEYDGLLWSSAVRRSCIAEMVIGAIRAAGMRISVRLMSLALPCKNILRRAP
jgi:hypothetical protein